MVYKVIFTHQVISLMQQRFEGIIFLPRRDYYDRRGDRYQTHFCIICAVTISPSER